MSYDPKLREAMAEIKEVMKKFDIGGYVALVSKTHAEFEMPLDLPTWSVIRYIKDKDAVHIKLHAASRPDDTRDSVHMVASLRDLCVLGFGQTDEIFKKIDEQVNIVHVPFGGGVTNEDR